MDPRYSIITLSGAAFFILAGYEFFRSTSAALFQAKFGVQNLPLAMALIPCFLIFALYFYNQLLSKVKPRHTLLYTSAISLLVLLVSLIGIYKEISLATWVYYIFREVYIVLIIEQYWSFVNSTLDELTARKWTGILTGCGSAGAILGGVLVHQLSIPLGTKAVSVIGIFFLFISIILADLSFRMAQEPLPTQKEVKMREDRWLGAHLLFTTPLLTFLFLLVMTTQMMSTVLGLNFQSQLQIGFPNVDQQTAYSGSFYALLNGVSLVLQFVGAPLLLRFTSVTWIQLMIPVVHVGAALALVLSPSLFSSALAFMLFKSFDYSLFRVSKEMLYMPLSFDARYRAKELIDIFGYRMSKGVTSLGIMALQKVSFFSNTFYGGLSLVASCFWFLLILPIARAAAMKTQKNSVKDVRIRRISRQAKLG
jgi:ATP:ADP antiporter, AAA family